MKREVLDIRTVCECNRCLGCKTLHPQVTIINLAHSGVEQERVKFEFLCGSAYRGVCGRLQLLWAGVLRLFPCHDGVFEARRDFPDERGGCASR